jgi:hypothetical protein
MLKEMGHLQFGCTQGGGGWAQMTRIPVLQQAIASHAMGGSPLHSR